MRSIKHFCLLPSFDVNDLKLFESKYAYFAHDVFRNTNKKKEAGCTSRTKHGKIKERPLSQCIWLSSNHLNHTSKKGKLNILRVDPRKSALAALISHVLCIFISFHYLTYKWCMVKYTGFCSKMVRYTFKPITSFFEIAILYN